VPYKDPAKREAMAKVYKARWYQKNKLVTKERTRANKRKQKVVWDAFKASQACSHCGTTHPSGVIIDFHHVDRTDKQSVPFLGQELPVCGGDGGDQKVHPLVRQLPPDPALGRT
jgi:hypothetical protein